MMGRKGREEKGGREKKEIEMMGRKGREGRRKREREKIKKGREKRMHYN